MRKLRQLVLSFAVVLASCGGSGGGDTNALTPEGLIDLSLAATQFDVDVAGSGGDSGGDSGVGGGAGDGAPLKSAVILLTDSQGKTVTGQTDAKGSYLVKFRSADFKPPFVLKAIDAGGNVLTSMNEITIPSGKAARVNINPLTDKVVSDVLPAAISGTDKQFDGSSLNTAGLGQAKANLLTSIQGALAVASVSDSSRFDPVRSAYKYDGTGVDAIIESISHGRNPSTGATQLQSKLAPLVTNADGTVVPVLITASTPLAIAQVALPTNPALTFSKISAWVNQWNTCLANGPTPGGTSGCSLSSFDSLLGAVNTYKQTSRDFFADFRTLCSETGNLCVRGSEFRNPNILFIGRYPGSTTDDLAVVEVTIRQPRTGPLAGDNPNPIEYTKTLVFKRDDVTPGLTAGNWYLHGNQRAFDWSIEPQYFSSIQTNAAKLNNASGGAPSFMVSGLRLAFSTTVFDPATRGFTASGVYAVRLKGPGLPAAGIVYVPSATSGQVGSFRPLNKTGVIPSPGTTTTIAGSDFRMAGVVLGTSIPLSSEVFGAGVNEEGSPSSINFNTLTAFSLYSAEIFTGTSTTPIVETSRILAPIQSPETVSRVPLTDLSANTALVTPPQPASSSTTVQWTRTPGAARIESAFANFRGDVTASVGNATVGDAFSLTPTSTSVVITNGTTGFPAATINNYREVGVFGRAGRASYLHSIRRNP